MKKLLALLLAMIMVISLLPAVSIAEEPRETYGDDYSEWQSWWNGSTETFYWNSEGQYNGTIKPSCSSGAGHEWQRDDTFPNMENNSCINMGVVHERCGFCGGARTTYYKAEPHTRVPYAEPDQHQDPTCTEAGWNKYKCKNYADCGQYETEELPALGHSWVRHSTTAPTATKTGKIVYKCTRCGESYTETLPVVTSYKAPKKVSYGGQAEWVDDLQSQFDRTHGVRFLTGNTSDCYYEAATNTLHLNNTNYKDPRNDHYVILAYAEDLAAGDDPYINIAVDATVSHMDVYLIDFGTTRTNSGGTEVPRKGLRNISASGAMDLHVYLISSNLGFIDYLVDEAYVYPICDGSDTNGGVELRLTNYDAFIKMGGEVNATLPGAVHCAIYEDAPMKDSQFYMMDYYGRPDHPFSYVEKLTLDIIYADFDYAPNVEAVNMTVDAMGAMTVDDVTGEVVLTEGRLSGIGGAKLINCVWETDKFEVYDFAQLEFENSEVAIDSLELHNLAQLTLNSDMDGNISVFGTNTVRLVSGTLRGTILAAAANDDEYQSAVEDPNSPYYGAYSIQCETHSYNRYYYYGARLNLLLAGDSHIELENYNEAEDFSPAIMIDNAAILVVNDDPNREGTGKLTVHWDYEYPYAPYYPFTSIGGTASLEPEPHGGVFMQSGVLDLYGYLGGAALGGSGLEPEIWRDYLGEVGVDPEPNPDWYDRIEIEDGAYYGVVEKPGFCRDGGTVVVSGGVINAESEDGGAGVGGARGGNAGSIDIMAGGSVNAKTNGGAAAIGGGDPSFEENYVLVGFQMLKLKDSNIYIKADDQGNLVYAVSGNYNGHTCTAGESYDPTIAPLEVYYNSAIYKKLQNYVCGGGSGELYILGGASVTAWADNPLYTQTMARVDLERNVYHDLLPNEYERQAMDPRTLMVLEKYYNNNVAYYRYNEIGYSEYYFTRNVVGFDYTYDLARVDELLPDEGYPNGREPGYVIGSSCNNVIYDSRNVFSMKGSKANNTTVILGQNDTNQYTSYMNPKEESAWDNYYLPQTGIMYNDAGEYYYPSEVNTRYCAVLRIGYHWEGDWDHTDFEGYQVRHNLEPKAYALQGYITLPSVEEGMEFTIPKGTTLTLRSGSILDVGENVNIFEDPEDEDQLVLEDGAVVRGKGGWPNKPSNPEYELTAEQIRDLQDRIEGFGGDEPGAEETFVVTHLGVVETYEGRMVIPGNSAEEIRQKMADDNLDESTLLTVFSAADAGFAREIDVEEETVTWRLCNYSPDVVVSLLENGALKASPGVSSRPETRFDLIVTEHDDNVTALLQSPILSTPAYSVFEGLADEEIEIRFQPPGSEIPLKIELSDDQVRNNKCIFSVPKFGSSELTINTISPLRNKCAVRFAGKMNFNLIVSDVVGVNVNQIQFNYNKENESFLGGIDGGGSVGIPDFGGFPVNGKASMYINTFAPHRTLSLDVSLETPVFSGAFRGSITEVESLGTFVVDSVYAEMAVGKGGIPLVPPTVVGYLQGGGLGISGIADTLENNGKIPDLRFEISAKASLLDAVSGWARGSVGPNGFDLKLTDIKVADYKWIKELGVSGLMQLEERTIDGITYWGINTDFSTYLVVGIPITAMGYEAPEDNENASGLNATGRVGIGCFAGYKKAKEGNGTYLYFIYQLRASGSLDGSLVIPKHLVGPLPTGDMTLGSVGVGFYAEANASTKVNATEVASTASPKNLLKQLSSNAELKFKAAIGAKASVGIGFFKIFVRSVYVLGQNNIDFSCGWGDGGEWDLSGYLGKKAVSTSGYDTTLSMVQEDGAEGPIPAIVQTGVSTVATLSSEPERGAEDTVSMVLNPDGTVSVTVNQALAGNVLITLTLDQLVETLSAANVSVNNGAFTLIPDVFDENGISTVPNANFCVSSVMDGENEVSAICFVPYAAGTYTFALNNTSAAFAGGQALVSAEFASFDPATQLGADSLSYTVNDAAENGRYKVQIFLGEEEGKGDYLLAETDELTPETLSGVLNASFSGNLAPGGSYYPSILLLEYVDAADEAGQTVGSWAAIDQINLSETRTYTNADEIPAPTGVTLAYAGNGTMAAAWNAVSGADAYQISVYQEVPNTAWDEDEEALVPVEGTHFEDTGLSFETEDTSILMSLSSLYGDPAESRNLKIGVSAVKYTAATIQNGGQEIEDPDSEDQYKTGREGLSAAVELARAVPVTVTYSDNVKGEENDHRVAAGVNGAVFTVSGPEEARLNFTVKSNQTGEILASETGVDALEFSVPAPTEELTASPLILEIRAEDPATGDYDLDYVTVNYDVVAPPIILDNLGRFSKWGTDYGFHAEITGHSEAGAAVCVYSIAYNDWTWDYDYELVTIVTASEDGSFSIPMNFTGDPAYCVQAVDAAGNQSVALIVEFPEPEIKVNLDPNGGSCVYSSLGFDSGRAIGELPTPSGGGELDVFDCWYMNVETGIETDAEGLSGLEITEVSITSDMIFTKTEDGETVVSAPDGTILNTYEGDPVLYARWAEGVTLTYEPGEDAACDTATKLYKPGSAVGELPVPRRTDEGNCLFLGWYSGDTRFTEISVISENTTLEARWTPAVTVSFDADLGDLDLTGVEDGLTAGYLSGASLVIPVGSAIANYPVATATGYSFDGWYNGDTAVQPGDVYSEDLTLTAHWSRITAPLTVSQTGCLVGETLPDPVYTPPEDMVGDPIITYYRSIPYVDVNGENQIKTYSSTAKPTEAGHYTVQVECGTFEKAYVGSAEFNIVGALDDGFYLIGPDWSMTAINAEQVFTDNPAVQGEYMLTTTLAENQKIKVVKVQNNAITTWYPDGMGNEYTVDAAHAGEKTIYFRESYNGAWAAFGGFFWIEANAAAPTEPIETSDLHVYSSISVGTDMVVTFTARKNDLTNYENFWIEVVKHAPDGDVTYTYGRDVLTENSSTWVAQFKNLFAKEMGLDVEARLCAENASGQVFMSPARVANIRDYLGGKLTSTGNKVQQRVLAADMLNYGAAAQMFTGYETDHLVNQELTAAQLAKLHQYETTALAPVNKTNYNTRPTGQPNILFNSVTLGNEVVLNLTIRLSEGTENVRVLVKDHATGETVTDLETFWSGSSIQAAFSGIGADKMRTEYDFVTLVNGVETGNIRTWSVEGYVGEIRNGSQPLKTAMANALLAYGDSAAAYFAAQ